jgi:hypothetical protein
MGFELYPVAFVSGMIGGREAESVGGLGLVHTDDARKLGCPGGEGDSRGEGVEMRRVRTGISCRSDERGWVRRQLRTDAIIMSCPAVEASGKK